MLKVGDIIKCADKEDAVHTMNELSKNNVETDFMYEKDGVKGLYLIVTKVGA